MTTPFSAAINLSAGADGLFMAGGQNVFRADFDVAEAGDFVCVLLGCATPILLRPVVGSVDVSLPELIALF
jgi:hypothetical protein